jgi:Protein of unknown function (DUF3105)
MLAAGLVATLSGCGASAAPSASSSGTLPVIKFVGNNTCPTPGVSTYNTNSSGQPVPPQVNSFPPVGQAINEMPHTHVNPPQRIQYNHNPPTSGCHYNLGYGTAPIQTGAYDREVQPEYWVHNLEHGYIVVLYNCPSGCQQQFTQLRQWYKGLPADPTGVVPYAKVVILPYAEMSVPFAALSWDWYDPIPVFSVKEVQRFYANHVGHGPERSGQ